MNKESRIFVAGHGGLLGSAVCRQLKKQGFKYILTLARKDTDYLNYSKLLKVVCGMVILCLYLKIC